MVTIEDGVNVREQSLAKGNMQMSTAETLHDTKGVISTVSLPSAPVRMDEIDHFLYAALQTVTEDDSSPYKKEYTGLTAPVNFSDSAGHVLTLFKRFGSSDNAEKLHDCVVTDLTFTFEPGGRLMYTATLQSRNKVDDTSSPSGTWTAATDTTQHEKDLGRFTWNSNNMIPLGSCEIKFTHEFTTLGYDATNDIAENVLMFNPVHTFSFTTHYDATILADLRDYMQSGAYATCRVGWGNATAGTVDNDLDFNFYSQVRSVQATEANGIQAIEWSGVMAGAGGSPVTVTLANDTNRAW
jgi:hypothetical protein